MAIAGVKCRVYGCKPKYYADGIVFCSSQCPNFVSDFVSCKSMICDAKSGLIGIARYLGKKVFVVPCPGRPDQEITARQVYSSELGRWNWSDDLDCAEMDLMNNPFIRTPSCGDSTLEVCKLIEDNYEN